MNHVFVSEVRTRSRTSPKSTMTGVAPSERNRMLSGLMSRWINPLTWACRRPEAQRKTLLFNDAVQDAAHFKGSSLLTISLVAINRKGDRIEVARDDEPLAQSLHRLGFDAELQFGGGGNRALQLK